MITAFRSLQRLINSPTILSQVGGIINMGSALLVLPLMIAILPASDIALWLYYSLFVGMGMMTDFGFGQALLRSCAYYYSGAKNIPLGNEPIERTANTVNILGLETLLATFLVCYRWILVIALTVATLICLVGARSLVEASPNPLNAAIAGIIIIIGMGAGLRAAIWSNYIQGMGQVATCKRIELILGLGRVLLYTVALQLNQGLLGMAISSLAISIMTLYWHKRIAISLHRAAGASWPLRRKFDKFLFKRIWPATWRQGSIGLGGYLITQSGGLISGSLKDTGLTASYLFTLRLLSIARNLALAPVQVAVPQFIRLRTEGNISKLKRELFFRISLCLSISSILCLLFWWIGGIYLDYAGKDITLLPGSMYLLASVTAILEVNHCAYSVFYITNNRVPFLWASLISGASIVILSILVVEAWSIWGLLIVQAMVQLMYNNWYPVYLVMKEFRERK